jgi:hypothetical protein
VKRRRAPRSGLWSLALGAGLAVAACRPKPEPIPTERLLITKIALAPALSQPHAFMVSDRAARWGEVFQVRGRQPEHAWKGQFDGRLTERKGLVELGRTPSDTSRFAFAEDFLEADVPTTSWLCAHVTMAPAHAASCAGSLLRTVAAESTLLAYLPCWRADCPVAELRGGAVTQATLPALSDLRVVAIDGRPIVLATTHTAEGLTRSATDVVVLLLDPPLQRAGALRLDETDATAPDRVTYRLARLAVEGAALRVTGRVSQRDRVGNQERSGVEVDERWAVGADGKLSRR